MIKSSDIVYIAGPMTGKKLFNYPKFFGMAGLLQKVYGCEILNPARQPDGLSYEEYMARAMADIARATVIVLMDGWCYSHGATLEYQAARERGIRILAEYELEDEIQEILKLKNPTIRIGEL